MNGSDMIGGTNPTICGQDLCREEQIHNSSVQNANEGLLIRFKVTGCGNSIFPSFAHCSAPGPLGIFSKRNLFPAS